jgi:anaerobic selenocysteine-containing dehydrogenase
MVKVERDEVTDIRPNPVCPNNISNNSAVYASEVETNPYAAKLCAKGYAAASALTDPDRVRTPLRRLGKRGEAQWEPISWDQA